VASRTQWIRDTDFDDVTTGVSSGDCPVQDDPCGAVLMVLTGSRAGSLEIVDEECCVLGREQNVSIVFHEPTVSRQHASLIATAEGHRLRDLDSSNGTFVDEVRVDKTVNLPLTCRIRLGRETVLQYTLLDAHGLRAHRELRQSLMLDPLTGVGKRSHFEQRAIEEVRFARRHESTVGVLLLDLDHFKDINDRFGHTAGDAVLEAFARLLVDTVRHEDVVFRYGGDEFCVLLRGPHRPGLEWMALRLRKAVEALVMDHVAPSLRVTASIGAAGIAFEGDLAARTWKSSSQAREKKYHMHLVDLADQALIRAKRAGRNRVRVIWKDLRS